ncbi:D-serine dehydratase-like domain [Ceraceosorus bombacis]|uniref:D-serine dehydratase-like domain n=1 Tax=Ceraceosorus bombacis TaxID=401625 RepID=A0A0P1BCD0_9BASI|nr:D-serine dehydratase-like domain [Ceraceosorus bombacis]
MAACEASVHRADLPSDVSARIGRPLSDLPTPSCVVDVHPMRSNIARIYTLYASTSGRIGIRWHLKTHKTWQATREMLRPAYVDEQGTNRRETVALAETCDDARGTDRAIVSTIAELQGLLTDGIVNDAKSSILSQVLYGLPLSPGRIPRLAAIRAEYKRAFGSAVEKENGTTKGKPTEVQILLDDVQQIEALEAFAKQQQPNADQPWQAFIKVDCGYRRAGVPFETNQLTNVLHKALASPAIHLVGFYTHAGHSYGSRSHSDASSMLSTEINAVSSAAKEAHSILRSSSSSASRHPNQSIEQAFTLSVGATPTFHAGRDSTSSVWNKILSSLPPSTSLELHAGNAPFLDLQQVATRLNDPDAISRCAVTVLSEIISVYPRRRPQVLSLSSEEASDQAEQSSEGHWDEALCDAAGTALSKDTGPFSGHGHVYYPKDLRGWKLDRISQEHGVLAIRDGQVEEWEREWGVDVQKERGKLIKGAPRAFKVGEKVRIVPQHACMVAAAHEFLYIVDSSDQSDGGTIADVWRPWKGW